MALIADPPVVRAGRDIPLQALVVDPRGGDRALRFVWSACASDQGLGGAFGGAQFGLDTPKSCVEASARPLGETTAPRIVVPGALTEAMASNTAALAVALGGQLSEEQIARVLSSIGLPLQVQVTVKAMDTGQILTTAYKRVAVIFGERTTALGANPPPPRFSIDGAWMREAGPFACAPEGDAPRIVAGSLVELAPDPNDEMWRESYAVLYPSGGIAERREGAYYSWYATDGRFNEDITVSPTRNVLWRAPDVAGPVRLWLVVRDGHGGTSACGISVNIADATDAGPTPDA